MKDKLQALTLAIITVAVIMLCSYVEHTYTMTATVFAVDENTTTFVDCMDCFWEYAGDTGLNVDDAVTLKFNDHCSASNRCDDIVVSFKKR